MNFQHNYQTALVKLMKIVQVYYFRRKYIIHGSSVVSAMASGARGPRFDPRSRQGKFRSQKRISLVSFARMDAPSFGSER